MTWQVVQAQLMSHACSMLMWLSSSASQIEVPAGAIQAKNSAGKIGYAAPCPPKGTTHNYLFEVDALDTHLTLTNGVDADKLIQAISDAESQAASDSGNVTR